MMMMLMPQQFFRMCICIHMLSISTENRVLPFSVFIDERMEVRKRKMEKLTLTLKERETWERKHGNITAFAAAKSINRQKSYHIDKYEYFFFVDIIINIQQYVGIFLIRIIIIIQKRKYSLMALDVDKSAEDLLQIEFLMTKKITYNILTGTHTYTYISALRRILYVFIHIDLYHWTWLLILSSILYHIPRVSSFFWPPLRVDVKISPALARERQQQQQKHNIKRHFDHVPTSIFRFPIQFQSYAFEYNIIYMYEYEYTTHVI